MPTYYGIGTKIKLLVSDLSASTANIADPQAPRQNANANAAVQLALDKATVLLEETIPYLGDDKMPCFLDGDITVPFYQVKVGKMVKPQQSPFVEVPKRMETRSNTAQAMSGHAKDSMGSMPPPSLTGQRSATTRKRRRITKEAEHTNVEPLGSIFQSIEVKRRPKILPPLQKALSLNIDFDPDRSFKRDAGKPMPLKTEVYFNGQLANSALFALHQRSEKTFKTQRHSGLRNGKYVELPWVIVTGGAPTKSDDGDEEHLPTQALKRWTEIGVALSLEANKGGLNAAGIRSPSGQVLDILASMEMPESILELITPGSLTFGIIDVIVSRGTGAKAQAGSSYLSQITSLLDLDYGSIPKKDSISPEPKTDGLFSYQLDEGLNDEAPSLGGLDGAADPKTPLGPKRRRQSKSSAIIPPDADESDHDVDMDTSLGFLASAQSSEPHTWNIVEPLNGMDLSEDNYFDKPDTGLIQSMNVALQDPSSHIFTSSPPTRPQALNKVNHNLSRIRSGIAEPQQNRKTLTVKLKTPSKSKTMNASSEGTLPPKGTSGKEPGLTAAHLNKTSSMRIVLKYNSSTPIKPSDSNTLGVALPLPSSPHTPLIGHFPRRSPQNSTMQLTPLQRLARRPDADYDLSDLRPVLALAEGEDAVRRTSGLPESSPLKNLEYTKEFRDAMLAVKDSPLAPDKAVGPEKRSSTDLALDVPHKPSVPDMPELSRGCVLTYAHTEHGIGPLRQVKAERQGTFKEKDVLVAVRFLIGVGAGEE